MLIISLAVVVAIAAAVRSTWSPCGLSMLSTITPMGERGRNNRFPATATAFIVGGVLGGATLGLLTAALAFGVARFDLSATTVLGAAAVLAIITAASDLKPFGWQLPFHTRQVNEMWLDQYRSWVYGTTFGWQIGVGLATYIMTAAVYLLIALAALTANPAAAFGVAVLFGLVRGLAVLLGARITTPAALIEFHRRFDLLAQPVRFAVIATQFAVAAIAAGASIGPVAAVVVAVAGAAGIVAAVTAGSERRPRAAVHSPA